LKENTRLKKRSILKVEKKLQEKHNLPKQRKPETFSENNPEPCNDTKLPFIHFDLSEKMYKKSSDVIDLQKAGLQTIQQYPDDCIHVYTDGSASQGTVNAGYGARIEFPDKSLEELSRPCGENCSNFEAEALAIKAAIEVIEENLKKNKYQNNKVIIFTDAKSVLQAIDSQQYKSQAIQILSSTLDKFIKTHDYEVILQWIPSHCEIKGNERADTLAKKGASQEQPERPVSHITCKQIIKANSKTEWVNSWSMCSTGRVMYPHMTAPTKTDPIDDLDRREQCIIFRLRSQHIPLNMHLNMINPMQEPVCPLCPCAYETVEHFLFECPQLSNIRDVLLPPCPNIDNTLYSNSDQLKRTAQYFMLVNRQRVKTQDQAGSR